jgi:ketosteroid isomerase-like protein
MYKFFLLLVSFLLSCSAHKHISEEFYKDVAEEIKQLEFESISAEFRLDTGKIAQALHENFIAVYPDRLQNKQEELDGIYKNISERIRDGETMDSLYLDDFHVQVYGNVAIATFYTVTKGYKKGTPYTEQRWRWYDVWIKQRDAWKLVSSQGTPIRK